MNNPKIFADLQALFASGGVVQVRLVLGVSVRSQLPLPARATAGLHAEEGQEAAEGAGGGQTLAGGVDRDRTTQTRQLQTHQSHTRNLRRVEKEENPGKEGQQTQNRTEETQGLQGGKQSRRMQSILLFFSNLPLSIN
jgi:hypothetical protein